MLKWVIVVLIALAVASPWSSFAQLPTDFAQAWENLQQVQSGQKNWSELSGEEQLDVLRLMQIMRPDPPSDDPDCTDAWDDAGSAADDLERYAKKLAKCAGSGGYDDDCNREWRKTKRAYSNYDSAVSDVQSNCD